MPVGCGPDPIPGARWVPNELCYEEGEEEKLEGGEMREIEEFGRRLKEELKDMLVVKLEYLVVTLGEKMEKLREHMEAGLKEQEEERERMMETTKGSDN